MEETPLPTSQIPQTRVDSDSNALESKVSDPTVSSYSAGQKNYPLETLEVRTEGSPAPVAQVKESKIDKYAYQRTPFSRSKATVASIAITLGVVLFTGGIMAYVVKKNAQERVGVDRNVPTQGVEINNKDAQSKASEFQDNNLSLLVGGDIITRGDLRVSSGGYITILKTQANTANQTLTLPNSSGVLCTDSNNCGFATTDQLNQVQGQLPSQTRVNGFDGGVQVQGTSNRISVVNTNGVITLSTPQSLNTSASVQFASLLLSSSLKVDNITPYTSGGNLTVTAGSGQIIFGDSGRTFGFPAGGLVAQTICTTQNNCNYGSGNGDIVNGGQIGPIIIGTNDASILQFETSGVNRVELQANGNVAFDTDTLFVDSVNNRVGVGTATPSAKLSVQNGSLLVQGTYGGGNGITVTGAGTRMFFDVNKGAFRAGTVNGTEWDASNIGTYSAAFGYLNSASGMASFAAGQGSRATGSFSVAIGGASVASGEVSSAFGRGTTAQGYASTAIGECNTPQGTIVTKVLTDQVFAIGNGTFSGSSCSSTSTVFSVLHNGSTTLDGGSLLVKGSLGGGNGITVTGAGSRMFYDVNKAAFRAGGVTGNEWNDVNVGNYSFAAGNNNFAQGSYTSAFGGSSSAAGNYSTTIGFDNFTVGVASTAIGYGINTSSFAEVAVGYCNATFGSQGTWVSTDPLFSVGNGTYVPSDCSLRQNAFAVLKNGDTTIAGNLTVAGTGISSVAGSLKIATSLNFTKEIAHTIKINDSTTAATAGALLSILGANGNGAAGGGITVTGGTGSGFQAGGSINITGGNGFGGGAVNINGGGGGFGTGNVVLQNSPTTGVVSIGGAPLSQSKLSVIASESGTTANTIIGTNISVTDTGIVTTGTDTTNGLNVSVTRTGATGGTITSTGGTFVVAGDTGGSSSATGVHGRALGADVSTGVQGLGVAVGTSSFDSIIGVDGQVGTYFSTGATVTNAFALQGAVGIDGGTATITNAAGLNIKSATNSSGGTITNNYGIKVANQTVGASDYGLYIEGADTYALWVDSGATRLDGTLEVRGHSSVGSDAQINGSTITSVTNVNTASMNSVVTVAETVTDFSKDSILGTASLLSASPTSAYVGNIYGGLQELKLGGTQSVATAGGSATAISTSGSVDVDIIFGNNNTLYLGGTGDVSSFAAGEFNNATAVNSILGSLIGSYNNIESAGSDSTVGGLYSVSVTGDSSVVAGVVGSAGAESGNVGTINGISANASAGNAAVIGQMNGLDVSIQGDLGSTVATAIGLNVNDIAHAGTVTDSYGIKVGNVSGATNNYGVYIDGGSSYSLWVNSGTSRFGGNVGINSSTAPNKLNINTLTVADANAQLAVASGGAGNKGIVVQGVNGQTADLFQAQDYTGSVLASVSATGDLVVVNATVNGTLVVNGNMTINGHFISGNSSGSTTVVAGVAADCSATGSATISGNDTAGTITINTSTGVCVTGTAATITFANVFGVAPKVTLTPADANAASLQYYSGNTTTSSFTIDTGTAPATSTTYVYNYQVVQ